jgi:hypothetical protein
MSFFTAFSSSYLNHDEIKLGDLVLNIRDPSEAFCPDTIKPNESDYWCRPFGEVGGSNMDEMSASFSAMLTKLFTLGAHRNNLDDETIRAKQAKVYTLKNHGPYLQRQLKNKNVMEWILTHRRNKDIYMIVGYHTVVDAKVNNHHQMDKQIEAKAKIPASEVVLPGSSNTAIGQATNIGLDAKGSHKRDHATSFLAPGERIIGIKYRKLRLDEVRRDTSTTSDRGNSSFEITLKDKGKWMRFTGRNPTNSEPISMEESDEEIVISCSFAGISETDLDDIMQGDYDLESDQYKAGVFPTPQDAATTIEDEGNEKSLWVFIDGREAT